MKLTEPNSKEEDEVDRTTHLSRAGMDLLAMMER